MKRIFNLQKLFQRRKELRNNATPQEVLLCSRLRRSQLGVKFRRQQSIGGYIADFYCAEKKLVIEIDGSQHFQKNNKDYDRVRAEFFKGLDIKVLRFNNEEINNNLESVVLKIRSEI
jgi:very-short-patch-repair endonuclease